MELDRFISIYITYVVCQSNCFRLCPLSVPFHLRGSSPELLTTMDTFTADDKTNEMKHVPLNDMHHSHTCTYTYVTVQKAKRKSYMVRERGRGREKEGECVNGEMVVVILGFFSGM